jgi:hypothetical protein
MQQTVKYAEAIEADCINERFALLDLMFMCR